MSSPDVLMVSPLPPSRCGIASYAAEHLLRLRADDKCVITISPLGDSNADHHLDLTTVSACLASLLSVWRCKPAELVVHYSDAQFFPWRMPGTASRGLCRLIQSYLLRSLAQHSKKSLLVIHEILTVTDSPKFNTWTREHAFAAFNEVAFHTDSMRREFLVRFRRIASECTSVIGHTRFMGQRFQGTRAEARAALGIPDSERTFLCIGFIQESKGFHDAVEAFSLSGHVGTTLRIVGSTESHLPTTVTYAKSLRTLCAKTPGVHLHEGYLDDTTFDTWLAAADVLLLPYLGVTSSGVGARASLYNTSLIVRNLPNLTEQFPDALTFDSVNELAEHVRKAGQKED